MQTAKPIHLIRKPLHWLMPLLLACALLVAQTLGFMHGVVHTRHGQLSGKVAASSIVFDHQKDSHAGNWLNDLFASHGGDNDCRLYDQASHGSAAPQVAALLMPVLPPSFAVAIFEGEALARWAALFDARGPPLTS